MENKVKMSIEKRDGKIYIVAIDPPNHHCGQIAVGNDGKLPKDLYDPKDILDFFIREGYQW